jgi:transcriptional regulator with XRE-family HTH domain
MPKTRRINSVDNHISKRMHDRRKAVGMTLEELAENVHLTYQQIQKYERAINRVPAARLYDVARALKVPIGYFFEGLPK